MPEKILSRKDWFTLTFWGAERIDLKRGLRWVQSLKRASDILMSSPTPEAATVFWLRLHGVIGEMLSLHKPTEPVMPEIDPSKIEAEAEPYDDQSEYFSELSARVHDACVNLRDAFTEDERLVIQWKRDDESHVELTAYEPREENGKINWMRRTTVIGPVHHDRIHDAVRVARNGRDDTEVAAEFAARAAIRIDKMIAALERYPDH